MLGHEAIRRHVAASESHHAEGARGRVVVLHLEVKHEVGDWRSAGRGTLPAYAPGMLLA